MTAWDTIRAALAVHRTLTNEDAWCGVIIEHDGEQQKVVLEPIPALRCLLLVAHVCKVPAIHPGDALRYNARSTRGHLAIERDGYILRDVRALALDGVEPAIEDLAREAIRLRRAGIARETTIATAPFLHLAD